MEVKIALALGYRKQGGRGGGWGWLWEVQVLAPAKPDDCCTFSFLSYLLLKAGSAVGADQVARGFVQSQLGNCPGLETAQGLWAYCSTAVLSLKVKRFSLQQIWTSSVPAGACCVSLSQHTLLCRASPYLLKGLLSGPSKAISSPGSIRAIPSAVVPRAGVPGLPILVSLCWICLHFLGAS